MRLLMQLMVNMGDWIVNRLKIVHVQVIPKLSGAQLFSLSLLSALPSELYEKYVIFSDRELVGPEQKEEIISRFSDAGVSIIWLSSLQREISLRDVRCFLDLYAIFKQYNFDIVHTNSTKPGILARVAARIVGVKKVIHTVHGIAYHANLSIFKRLFFYFIEVFSTLFCHNNISVNKYYVRYYKWLPFVRTMTIYNGVDFHKLGKEHTVNLSNKKFDFSNKTAQLLFVGRLDEQKDPLTLLRACNLLKYKYKCKFKMSIVGDGELLSECHSYCQNNNLLNEVRFHGWVSPPYRLYSEADVFVSSSIYEAFGFTLVEAAYYGLPIVATNVEGIPEVVQDNLMGYLVDPKSPAELASALNKILSDQRKLYQFSVSAHDSVVSRFSLEKMVANYRDIYEK